MAGDPLFLGVDVGTGSVRAGLFSADGRLLGAGRRDIRIWREGADIVEQSSEDIWAACGAAAREAVAGAGIDPARVAGLSFDATCSMVVLDAGGRPLPAGPSGEAARDIIVWMDHRATDQARRINATSDPVLDYVGGAVSPEMQTPKLLWLKERLPRTYAAAGHFLDLADFLTFRATGSLARSACTLTCKWTYLAHEGRWSPEFFERAGLGDLAAEGFRRIGAQVVAPGLALGAGLTPEAAAHLGLVAGTPVGAGLIDAHAGGLGTLGGRDGRGGANEPERRVAFIMGTSTCVMAVAPDPRFVPGVWGPYFSAMIPGLWLAEGGQSAAGAALDHLVTLHPAHGEAAAEAARRGTTLLRLLEDEAVALSGSVGEAAYLARDLHVLPDVLGNRSPHADPDARGVIAGLALDNGRESLARLYVAGLCGLAYGGAQILDALSARGYRLDAIVVSGGAARSPLVRAITAQATGRPVVLPETPEPVLLGAAMLGAVAAGAYPDLGAAMAAMARDGETIAPAAGRLAAFHAAKRSVYEDMQRLDKRARERMAGVG